MMPRKPPSCIHKLRYTLILLFALLISGCTTKHYGQALLYQKTDTAYAFVGSSSNPIAVPNKSQFQLTLEEVQPGWIHQGESKHSPDRNDTHWQKHQASHLFDKELWLLMRIETLSTGDVLERSKKTYFKSSNIKLQSASFLPMALDIDEKDIFTHEADSSYRINFQLYEVDGLALKRAISNAYGTPGLTDLLEGIMSQLSGGLKLLAGSYATDVLGGSTDDKSVLERVLLKAGASLEFKGSVLIVRNTALEASANTPEPKEYLLYDKLKSEANWGFDLRPATANTLAYGEKSPDGRLANGSYHAYQQALTPLLNEQNLALCIPQQPCNQSYIRLSLTVKKSGDTNATEGAKLFRPD